MKRILHVVGGMGLGGTETYLMNIYRNIDRNKLQFDFVTYDANNKNNFYEKEVIDLGGGIFELHSVNKWYFLKSIIDIRKILLQNEYCAIHAHTKYNSGIAMIAAWLANVNIRIVHSHNTGTGLKTDTTINKLYVRVMSFAINNFANQFAACSKKAAEQLFSLRNIKKRYRFMPNAVEFNSFLNIDTNKIENLKISLNIPQSSKVIGHVGRYGKAKNHEFIIEMFSYLIQKDNSFCLVLIGDGPTRPKIENMISSYGLNKYVRVLGLRNDIPLLMNIMDVFILPSLYEGLGIVLLEAQASGLPCIVSENIQPEADMNLGLMNWVNLNNIEKWTHIIVEKKQSKIKDKELIRNTISKSPFVLSRVVNKFYELYGLTDYMKN